MKRLKVNLGKADTHIHSNFSDGQASIEEILEYVEEKTDLDVIAITDHNTIEGAKLALELMRKKKYRFKLIIGEEIGSKEGHIVGLFLKSAISGGLSLKDTINEIKSQNGIAIAPHPFF